MSMLLTRFSNSFLNKFTLNTLKIRVSSIKLCIKRENSTYKLKKFLREARKMLDPVASNILTPPDNIRGMKKIDKDLFKKKIKVPCLELGTTNISKVMPVLKKYILKMENLKAIQVKEKTLEDTKENCEKFALFNPELIKTWDNITVEDRKILEDAGINENNLKLVDFTLNYENWKADELLRAILPQDKDAVAGFSKIGHIIHLNLREHVLDYKYIIGQILIDKVPGVKTVVNKLDKIDTTYRNFEMEVICGEKNMFVQMKQNHCKFEFDFSTVYFNTRLSTEHERIVKKLQSGDILYDVFAGVGPFAIPAAKKKCIVFANDLNSESFNWLNHNAKINKVNMNYLKTYNKDGADFIKEELKTDLENRFRNCETSTIHITMNLPALAPEFLKHFVDLLKNTDVDCEKITKYPIIHVYCFAKGEPPIEIAQKLVETNLRQPLPDGAEICLVRSVSNFKEMVRVSFALNRKILFGNTTETSTSTSNKRPTSPIESCNNKKFCNHGEKQTEDDEEKYLQSGWGKKSETES